MDSVTRRGMDPLLDEALRPPTPGRVLRMLAPVFPAIRTTRDQIVSHAHYWRLHAEAALEADDRARPTVVVLGDSLSQAVGASLVEDTWLHRIVLHESQRRGGRPAHILNLSRSGARIDDVMRVQLPALRAVPLPAQLVTCTVGSNDLDAVFVLLNRCEPLSLTDLAGGGLGD